MAQDLIQLGDVLQSEQSAQGLADSCDYYFLKSCAKSDRVFLVRFFVKFQSGAGQTETEVRSQLTWLKRELFEELRNRNVITKVCGKPDVPPWFKDENTGRYADADEVRRAYVKSHVSRIDSRFLAIAEACRARDDVLASTDPIKALNRFANQHSPVQNSVRFRCWFFSYWIWGRLALHYNLARIGHWDRQARAELKEDSASQVTPDRLAKIRESFQKCGGNKQKKRSVYSAAMTRHFGCAYRSSPDGTRELYHPKGEWFPTERIFLFHALKDTDPEDRRRERVGRNRARSEAPSKGSYTEHVVNIGEYVLYDPQYKSARPISIVNKADLALTCGRLRDGASGARIGIGFDVGGETREQFCAALFCAAIGMKRFAALFGLAIPVDDLPMNGIPLTVYVDRGPAATVLTMKDEERKGLPTVKLAPSHSGQSKAVVESSHDRTTDDEDGPHHFVSGLSATDMMRQEILATVRFNETSDVTDRIPPDWVAELPRPTPAALFRKQAEVGRCDLRQYAFEEAVRNFLPKIQASATRDGITLHGRPYKSEDLRKAGFFQRIPDGQTVDVDVYHLRACIAHLWIDWKGTLFDLEMTLKVAAGKEVIHMTLAELSQDHEERKRLRRTLQTHSAAMHAEADAISIAHTGKPLDHKRRVPGRVKRPADATQQRKVVRGKA